MADLGGSLRLPSLAQKLLAAQTWWQLLGLFLEAMGFKGQPVLKRRSMLDPSSSLHENSTLKSNCARLEPPDHAVCSIADSQADARARSTERDGTVAAGARSRAR